MKSPKISVIIPVYNVEKYLRRCVDSVLNQTYKDIEVILVDDGSPDKSPAICDEYVLKDNRVKVIHKLNGGQSSARNAGLMVAQGKFVTFVDSDDWIAKDTYEYCMNVMMGNGADAVQYEYVHVSSEHDNVVNPKEKVLVQHGTDILEGYMKTVLKTGSYSIVRCVFKKSVLDGLTFREGKNSEDLDFKFNVLSRCKAFAISNQCKYYYFQSPTSTSNGGLRKGDYDLFEAADILLGLAKKTGNANVIKMAEAKKTRTPFSLLCKMAYFGMNDKTLDKETEKKKLLREHKQNLITLLDSSMPFSRKVLAVMFTLSYGLTEKSIQLAKKIQSNYD